MFDEKKSEAIKAKIDGGDAPDVLTNLSHAELRRLRGEIDRLLPERALGDIDTAKELVEQYMKVKDLQDSVLFDEDVPANQRAQCAGQVASTLQQLVKMQTDFYTAERFRAIENLLIKYLRKMPLEVAAQFVAEYERMGDENV